MTRRGILKAMSINDMVKSINESEREEQVISDTTWNISYSANYFTLNITIQAPDENQAEAWARQNILEEYGIDLDKCGAKCMEVEIAL